MHWLIQGVYFQNQSWLDVVCVPVEGNIAVVKSGLIRATFAGVIYPDQNSALISFVGEMCDSVGISILTDVTVSETRVSYTKRYKNRREIGEIVYEFVHKEGPIFVGTYGGENVGNGIARCILTPVEPSFFDPISAMKLLGLATAHQW